MTDITILRNKQKQHALGRIAEERFRSKQEDLRKKWLRSYADKMDNKPSGFEKYYTAVFNAQTGMYALEMEDIAAMYPGETTPALIPETGMQAMIYDTPNSMLEKTGKISSRQLLDVYPEVWESLNPGIVNPIDDYLMGKSKTVAPLLATKETQRVMDESISVFYASKKNERPNAKFASEGIKNYEGVTMDFIDNALSQKVDSVPLEYQYAHSHGIAQTRASLVRGLQNIKDHNGEAVVYDLETSGRVDLNGNGVVGPNIIHEFSISRVNGNFGNETSAGDIVDFEKNKENILKNQTENSIIGASKEEYEYYTNLIKKKFDEHKTLTKDEEVTLERLALTGNEKTSLVSSEGKNGLFQFASFTEKEDLVNGITKEDAIKGAELFKQIGIKQGVYSGDTSKMIEYAGHQMYSYEASFLRGIMPTVLTENNQNPLTLMGHNIKVFDNPLIHTYANTDKASVGFKKFYYTISNGKQMVIPNQVDDLPVESTYFTDRLETIKGWIDKFSSSPEEARKTFNTWKEFIKTSKRGTFTQESLMHALFQDSLQDAAHVANEDALGDARIIFRLGNEFEEVMANDSEARMSQEIASGQAFYAITSPGVQSNHMTAVLMDQATGQVRTSDGFAITESGVEQELFGQRGPKKHGLYEVVDVGEISKNNPLYEKLTKMNPDLGAGGTSFLRLRPIVKDAKSTEAYSDTIMFGTRERIEAYINNNMRYAGEYKEGKLDQSLLTDSEKEALSFVSLENGELKVIPYDKVDLIEESTFAYDNEAAARIARDNNIKKDQQMLNWINEVDAYAEHRANELRSIGGNPTESNMRAFKEEYRTIAKQNTLEIYESMAKGENVDKLMEQPNYIRVFGYDQKYGTPRGTNPMYAYSNTINAAVNRENFVRKNKDLVERTINAVLRDTGELSLEGNSNIDALNKQYGLRMQAAYDYVQDKAERMGANEREAIGFLPHGLSRDEIKSRFEIDLTGFLGIKENNVEPDANIVRLNLKSSAYAFIDPVVRKIRESNPDNTPGDVKAKIAQKLQDFMIRGGIINEPDEDHKIQLNDSEEIANSKLVEQLKKVKEKDMSAGLIKDTDRMDILHLDNINENLGLTIDEIDAINNESYSSFKKINPASVNDIDKIAEMINENIVTPDMANADNIKGIMSNGFTKEEAEQLRAFYRQKSKAGFDMSKSLVKGIFDAGGILLYDEATNKLMLQDPGKDGKIVQLSLPSQRFDNGNMYAEVGPNRSKKLDSIGVYTVSKNGEQKYIFGSRMDVINTKLESKKVTSYLQRGLEHDGTMTREAEYIINSFIGSQYRDNIAELKLNTGDARLGTLVSFNELTENLAELENTKVMRSLKAESFDYIEDEKTRNTKIAFRDKLFRMIEESKTNPQKFSEYGADYSVALAHFMPYIQEAIEEQIGGDNPSTSAIKKLNFMVKQYGKGYAILGQEQFVGDNSHGVYKRGVEDVKLNAPELNEAPEKVEEYVLRKGEREIKFGSPMMSTFEESQLSRYSVDRHTALTMNGLNMSSADLNLMIQEGLKDSDYSRGTQMALSLINTTDAAGVMSPIASDMGLNVRTYEQRIRMDRLQLNNEDTVQKILSKSVMADITVDDDGNIHMSYRDGKFVYSDNSLYGKNRSNLILDTGEKVKIKEDGFLQHRFYKGDRLITEKEINDILNQEENKKKINAVNTQREKAIKAFEILQKEGLDSKLRVKTVFDPLGIKSVIESEKSETAVLGAGFGQENKKVRSFIQNLNREIGYKNDNSAFVKKLTGAYFTAEVLSSITEGSDNSLFIRTLNAFSRKKITAKHVQSALEKSGLYTVHALFDEAYDERMTYWNAFEEIARKEGILVEKDDKGNVIKGSFKHVDIIADTLAGQKKHMDITPLNQLIEEMQAMGKDNQTIVDTLANEGIYTGLSISDKGNIINNGDKDININKLVKYADSIGLNLRASREGKHDTKALVQRMTVRQAPNYDISKHNDLSYDERVITNLEAARLDANSKKMIDTALSNSIGAVDKDMEQRLRTMIDGNVYDGKTMYRNYMRNIRRTQTFTDGEDLVYSNYLGNEVNLSKADIEKTIETGEGNKGIKMLSKYGMSADDIFATIEGIKKMGADKITQDRVLDYYSLSMAINARNFNYGKGEVTLDNLVNNGYKVINIDELNTDAMSRDLQNSLMDNKVVIDLKSSKDLPGNLKLYTNESDRYIALPFFATGKADEQGNEIKSNIQSRVSAIANGLKKYIEEYPDKDNKQLAYTADRIKTNIDNLKTDINKYATSNQGIGKKVYVSSEQGVMKKAHAHKIYGNEIGEDLSRYNFEGINLRDFSRNVESSIIHSMGESFKKGLSANEALKELDKSKAALPYAILSRDSMTHNYKNIILDIEKQDKETARALSDALFAHFDSGNAAINSVRRYPTNYQGSESAIAVFYDTKSTAQNDIAYINEDFWNAVHGDSDSDSLNIQMIKTKAKVTIKGKTFETDLDKTSYELLNKMDGVKVELADNGALFEESKRNILNTAFTVAPRYYGKAAGDDFKAAYEQYGQTISEIKENHGLAADHDFTPEEIDTLLTNEERNKLRAHAHQIQETAITEGKLSSRTYDGENIAPQRMYTVDEAKKYDGLYSQLRERTRDAIGTEAFDALSAVEQSSKMKKYASGVEDIEALKFNKLREEVINSNSAISGKKSAGILDTAMYSYFKMAEQSGVLSANETRALQMIRVAAQEGTTLTSKSETAGADPDKIQKVQEAMNKLMRYTTGSSGEKWEEEKSEIRATLQDALSERKGKELSELSDEFTTYKDGEKVGDMDKIMDFMMSLPERIRGNGSTRNSLKTFDSQSGSAIDKMAEVSSYEGSLIGNAAEGVNEISQNLGLGKAVRVIEPPRPSAPHNAAGASPDNNSTTRDIAEQTMRDSKAFDRLARNSRQLASKGGLGAIGAGIAVGIMGLGYLSGNHSPAPAATMANDAAAYESQQNQNGEAYSAAAMPSLSDTNLNVQRGGPNQGYVININAQTSGGQQAVQQAIMGAATTLSPQNSSVNISMNTSIVDKINQLQLHRMVAQSMGVQY